MGVWFNFFKAMRTIVFFLNTANIKKQEYFIPVVKSETGTLDEISVVKVIFNNNP